MEKGFSPELDHGLGTITIRVVVLARAAAAANAAGQQEEVRDADAEEPLPETDKRPNSGFLEDPKRGKQVCVFLINGQRQHAWDNQFIVRDLGLKYLRNRMLVLVDCDGLRPEAIAELMQGSRHQFLEGRVYTALESRVISTLKDDPDLQRLEEEVEDEIASLEAGDEVVKSALDQLIEAHHEAAERSDHGSAQPGKETRQAGTDGNLDQSQDVVVDASTGPAADEPVLRMKPDVSTIRLKPSIERKFAIGARPTDAWKKVTALGVTFDPPVKELQVVRKAALDSTEVQLVFAPPADFDEDEYPIETVMRATASLDGDDLVRVLERRVVVTGPADPVGPPPPPKPLLDEPTFIKVTSRQPIRVVIDGPDVHVKLRWDGKDSLVNGAPPEWQFRATCDAPGVEPTTFLTKPIDGRFELLVQARSGLIAGEELKFDVEALGPGKTLSTSFIAVVQEAPSARRASLKVHGGGQRRPPYRLVYIKRENWESQGTDAFGRKWGGDEPGAFQEPTSKEPLTIFINTDTDALTTWRDGLVARRLAESTINQRVVKYTAHVAFHLYQMYLNSRPAPDKEQRVSEDKDEMMSDEIRRVATTLIKIMEVAS